jgi:hypothetical protein
MRTPATGTRLPVYEPPDLTGTPLRYRDSEVTSHGPDREYVYPGRRVVEIPGHTWPAARPEDCTDTSHTGHWLTDRVLVCRGCGLDST